MIYFLVRIIILVIILLIAWLLLRVMKSRFKINIITQLVSYLSCLIIFVTLLLIPFDNLFINFETPQEAFKYSFVNMNIVNIDEKDDSAMVTYKKNGSGFAYAILNKRGSKWSCCSPFYPFVTKTKIINGNIVSIVSSNKNLWIVITSLLNDGETLSISDNAGSVFENYHSKISNADMFAVDYYSYISYKNDYTLNINDEIIKLF